MMSAALFGAAALIASPGHARPRHSFDGPVEATVVEVLDGDTFLADAHIWPGQIIEVHIRIRGIDAPEMKSRCETEHLAALRARDALSNLLGGGNVKLSNIGGAKFYGRVLADVQTVEGQSVAESLLELALVRSYNGGRRAGWCG
jgi:endonuclease YncB( thermonuclease family)